MKYNPESINDRILELTEFISQTQKAMRDDDGTTIRISCQHGQTRYYLRPFGTKGDGIYLDRNNLYKVQPVVQRSYDIEAYKLAQQELLYLEQFLGLYPSKVVEDIYPSLHPARQKLITPVELPTDEFIQQWLSVEWEHKPFYEDDHSEYYNKQGVRMHSKEETIISNALIDRGKPQRYEYPIVLKGIGKVHPDFMILNPRTRKEYYWEHMGLWDDMTYRKNAIRRLAAYQRSGIFPGDQLILTFETSSYHPGFYDINAIIDHYLD